MSEDSESYYFYWKTFNSTYSKFVSTLKTYSNKYGLRFDHSDLLTNNEKCENMLKLLVTFETFDDENIYESIDSLESLVIGKGSDIKPLWNKTDNKEKKKLCLFIKLLKTTSSQVMTNSFGVNIFDPTNTNKVIELFSNLDNKKEEVFTVDDIAENVKKMESLESESIPESKVFQNIIKNLFSAANIDKSNIKEAMSSFKDYVKRDDFNKNFHKIISDTMGKDVYESTLKPLFNEVSNKMVKNIDNVDFSSIDVNEKNFTEKLMEIAKKLVPSQDTLVHKDAIKNITPDKLMKMMSSLNKYSGQNMSTNKLLKSVANMSKRQLKK